MENDNSTTDAEIVDESSKIETVVEIANETIDAKNEYKTKYEELQKKYDSVILERDKAIRERDEANETIRNISDKHDEEEIDEFDKLFMKE